MKKELCINGFSEVSEMEMIDIDGGITFEAIIAGALIACACAGFIVGCENEDKKDRGEN